MTTNDEFLALASDAQRDNTRCMIAFRDLARYLADCADHELSTLINYPDTFRIAFLDDDSDYIPAATRLLAALTDALTDDSTESACADFMHRLSTETDDDSFAAEPLDFYPDTLPAMPELD